MMRKLKADPNPLKWSKNYVLGKCKVSKLSLKLGQGTSQVWTQITPFTKNLFTAIDVVKGFLTDCKCFLFHTESRLFKIQK